MILSAIIVYSIIALLTLRPLTGHLAYVYGANAERDLFYIRQGCTNNPWTCHWVGGFCTAIPLALVWPIILIWHLTPSLSSRLTVGAESAARSRKRERRVEELEQELNLR